MQVRRRVPRRFCSVGLMHFDAVGSAVFLHRNADKRNVLILDTVRRVTNTSVAHQWLHWTSDYSLPAERRSASFIHGAVASDENLDVEIGCHEVRARS